MHKFMTSGAGGPSQIPNTQLNLKQGDIISQPAGNIKSGDAKDCWKVNETQLFGQQPSLNIQQQHVKFQPMKQFHVAQFPIEQIYIQPQQLATILSGKSTQQNSSVVDSESSTNINKKQMQQMIVVPQSTIFNSIQVSSSLQSTTSNTSYTNTHQQQQLQQFIPSASLVKNSNSQPSQYSNMNISSQTFQKTSNSQQQHLINTKEGIMKYQDQKLQLQQQQQLQLQKQQQHQQQQHQQQQSQHQFQLEADQTEDFGQATSQQFVDWSNIFNTHESYVIITKPEEVQAISQAILKTKPDPILGVDCEGLAKGRPLSLLQMYFAGKCYLFDLLAVNPFIYGLKEVMESKTIMKIFHDFCEDQSALINQYNLVCYFVFDTQIAHRVIQQAIVKTPKLLNYKDNNISLADLLKMYIDVVHTKKHEISAKMKNDDGFWERRPLTQDMIDYATQDVCYLPMVYQKLFKEYGQLKLIHQFYQNGQQYYEEMTVFSKIMRDTGSCAKYAFINRHIQDVSQLTDGSVIQAFIKNYQEYGVYCSLNVGVSGIVQEDQSVKQLRQYFDIGDIIQVQVEGQRRSGHLKLRFQGPQNPSMFMPPQVNQNFSPVKAFKPYNVKATDYSYGPINNHNQQHQHQQTMQISQSHQMTHYNRIQSAPFHPTTHQTQSSQSLNIQSPLYIYQQNTQHMYLNSKKNQKSMNVQSPEFVPNSSFSSSNGGDSTLNNTLNSEWASYSHQGNSSLNKTVTHDIQESPFNFGYPTPTQQDGQKPQQQQLQQQTQQNMIFNSSTIVPNTTSNSNKQGIKTLNPEKKSSFAKQSSQLNDQMGNLALNEEFKRSSSFINSTVNSSNNGSNSQRYFQMKSQQDTAADFMYKPGRMQQTSRDDTQNSNQFNYTQGAQGGQLKGSRSTPSKHQQISKQSSSVASTTIQSNNQQSDKQEIMSILNDTIAKLNINQSQTQMKLVVQPNIQTQSNQFQQSHISQNPQQSMPSKTNFAQGSGAGNRNY